MRKCLVTFFLFCCHSLLFSQWNETEAFGPNPGKLKMFTYGHSDSIPIKKPLVIVLHGCGQNAKDVAALTGWNKLADAANFWILYPQQQMRNNAGSCFNWFKEKDIEKGTGECESIYQMVVYMKTHYAIDDRQIYITGLSAGGAMTCVMLATHPELFKAGAIFAGGAYKSGRNAVASMASMMGINGQKRQVLMYHVLAQNPSFTGKYPRVIIYQGLSDPVVHPHNAELLVVQWTGVHNSSPYASKEEYAFKNITDITRKIYTNSKGDTVVMAYLIEHMGHQIPINPGVKPDEGGTAGLFGWEHNFHSTYQTAVDFGLIKRH